MGVKFPSLDDLTAKAVTTLTGAGRSVLSLADQWIIKTLILGVRDMVYMQALASQAAYEDSSALTAKGDALDQHCIEKTKDVRRKEESASVVRFSLSKSAPVNFDTTVPAGSLITTKAIGSIPALDFYTIDTVALTTGQTEVLVDAKCLTSGEVGNLSTLSIVFPGMVGIDSVLVVEVVAEGVDHEDDESLRARYFEARQNPDKGGTENDYVRWAKQVPGVVTVKVIPLARGPNTVDVIITGTNGMPTEALIAEVQAHIDGKKHPCVGKVLVKAPVSVQINVIAQVKMLDGVSFAGALPLMVEELESTIVDENKSSLVRLLGLQDAIRGAGGVYNLKIIEPTGDIPITNEQLAVAGNISITEIP